MSKKDATTWSMVKASLVDLDRRELLVVIRDLYQAEASNRRFLHARFLPESASLAKYRTLVREAVYPDPFDRKPVRLREATAIIQHFKRSTGDLCGVVELLLTFVEAGTEQAADLGMEGDRYFSSLETKLTEAVRLLPSLPSEGRRAAEARIRRLARFQTRIGWGFGDFLAAVAAELDPPEPP
jgi:hypothetical protein